jgi:hypothetical protein
MKEHYFNGLHYFANYTCPWPNHGCDGKSLRPDLIKDKVKCEYRQCKCTHPNHPRNEVDKREH